jgi:hypothetical protein
MVEPGGCLLVPRRRASIDAVILFGAALLPGIGGPPLLSRSRR